MTKQEKIQDFMEKHCTQCLNKKSYKCNIILDRDGNAKCSEENKEKK